MDNDLLNKYFFVNNDDYDIVKGPDWPDFADFRKHQNIPKWVYNEIDTMLFDQKSFDHPSFCVLPWHGKEIRYNGSNTHCCLMPNPYDINKIRLEMKQGIRPTECSKCWEVENNNLLSDRLLKNSTLDFYLKKNIQDIMQEAMEEKTYMVKVNTSFTCNGACVYCNSSTSSLWNSIEQRSNPTIPIKSYNFVGLENIEKQLDLKGIKTITFMGGEPLLERKNFDILQRLLDLENHDVLISIVTNASMDLTPEYQKILSNFKNLNLCLSIDGRNGIFNYQRWPLKWTDVEKNIEMYRKLSRNISVNCTITNISLLYYNDVKEWFVSQEIPWLTSPIYTPGFFSPKVLPVPVKRKFLDILSTDDYKAFIGDPDHEVKQAWQEFLLEIQRQDKIKGINIRDFVPEFCDLVGI